ncbi:hypothetical protein AD998_07680 [bacterium 336/3]|nr:hypothetical protein AD998_07680 [bacterium 336/3]
MDIILNFQLFFIFAARLIKGLYKIIFKPILFNKTNLNIMATPSASEIKTLIDLKANVNLNGARIGTTDLKALVTMAVEKEVHVTVRNADFLSQLDRKTLAGIGKQYLTFVFHD